MVYLLGLLGGVVLCMAGKEPPFAYVHGWLAYPAAMCIGCFFIAMGHTLWLGFRENR